MATSFKTGSLSQQYEQYRSYEAHQRRLKQIMAEKKLNMKVKETETDVLKSKIISNKMRANEFIESEKIKYIKKENQILLDKLLEISKGKHIAVAKHNTKNNPRSLNYFKMKRQAEKIDDENKHMLHRIISQGPVLNKRTLDDEFRRNNQYRSNIQKSKKTAIETILKQQRYLGKPAGGSSGFLPPIKRITNSSRSKSEVMRTPPNEEDTRTDRGENDASSLKDSGETKEQPKPPRVTAKKSSVSKVKKPPPNDRRGSQKESRTTQKKESKSKEVNKSKIEEEKKEEKQEIKREKEVVDEKEGNKEDKSPPSKTPDKSSPPSKTPEKSKKVEESQGSPKPERNESARKTKKAAPKQEPIPPTEKAVVPTKEESASPKGKEESSEEEFEEEINEEVGESPRKASPNNTTPNKRENKPAHSPNNTKRKSPTSDPDEDGGVEEEVPDDYEDDFES